jgi:hypothetical protein
VRKKSDPPIYGSESGSPTRPKRSMMRSTAVRLKMNPKTTSSRPEKARPKIALHQMKPGTKKARPRARRKENV